MSVETEVRIDVNTELTRACTKHSGCANEAVWLARWNCTSCGLVLHPVCDACAMRAKSRALANKYFQCCDCGEYNQPSEGVKFIKI